MDCASYEVISVSSAHPLFSNPYLQALPRDSEHVEASCQTSRPSGSELLHRKRHSLGYGGKEESSSASVSVINTSITQRTYDDSDDTSLPDWGRKVLHAHIKYLNKDLDFKEFAHNRRGCAGFVKFKCIDQSRNSKSRVSKEGKPRAPSVTNLPRTGLRPSFSQDLKPSFSRPKTAGSSYLKAKFGRRKTSLEMQPGVNAVSKGKDAKDRGKPHISVFDIRDIVQWTAQKREVWK